LSQGQKTPRCGGKKSVKKKKGPEKKKHIGANRQRFTPKAETRFS